jgi:Na+/H+ antiporter NhaD/arsenite permease-like protein
LCCLRLPPAGTGGSLLVIGSAAGVAYMGLEGAGFGWYMRKVTPWALLGYAAAISSYVIMHGLPSGSATSSWCHTS